MYDFAVLFIKLTVLFLAFIFVSKDSVHKDAGKLEDINISDWTVSAETTWNGPHECRKELPDIMEMSGDAPPVRSDEHALSDFTVTSCVFSFDVGW
mgnify:CR=1 FL=1